MPAARLCACGGSVWLQPDDDDSIPTTTALLQSAQVVGPRPIDIRAADLGDRQLYESPRLLLNAVRLSEPSPSVLARAPFCDGSMGRLWRRCLFPARGKRLERRATVDSGSSIHLNAL